MNREKKLIILVAWLILTVIIYALGEYNAEPKVYAVNNATTINMSIEKPHIIIGDSTEETIQKIKIFDIHNDHKTYIMSVKTLGVGNDSSITHVPIVTTKCTTTFGFFGFEKTCLVATMTNPQSFDIISLGTKKYTITYNYNKFRPMDIISSMGIAAFVLLLASMYIDFEK